MNVVLIATDEGVLLPVQAQPGARKNGLSGVHNGRLKVSCTQAPEKGKANKALIRVLAAALMLNRSQIRLHAGETISSKVFLVSGIEAPQLEQRIAALLPQQEQ
jgi:uncharacterized protein